MNYRLLAFIVFVTLATACSSGSTNSPVNTPLRVEPTPVPTTSIPKDGNYNSRGKVTNINLDAGWVELDHEDIPGLMPRMIMIFNVREPKELKQLKVGDQVDFVLEYKHPTETIVSIKKAQ
jgi:Cu/Ag efflux protein CusF